MITIGANGAKFFAVDESVVAACSVKLQDAKTQRCIRYDRVCIVYYVVVKIVFGVDDLVLLST